MRRSPTTMKRSRENRMSPVRRSLTKASPTPMRATFPQVTWTMSTCTKPSTARSTKTTSNQSRNPTTQRSPECQSRPTPSHEVCTRETTIAFRRASKPQTQRSIQKSCRRLRRVRGTWTRLPIHFIARRIRGSKRGCTTSPSPRANLSIKTGRREPVCRRRRPRADRSPPSRKTRRTKAQMTKASRTCSCGHPRSRQT